MGRIVEVFKNLLMGLVGALWVFIAGQDPASRPAFMVFGIVTVVLTLTNLMVLLRRKSEKSSG